MAQEARLIILLAVWMMMKIRGGQSHGQKEEFHHHEPMVATLSNPSPGIHRQLVTAVSTIDHPHRCQSPTPPPTMATHRSHPLRDSRRDRQIQQGGFPPIFFPQKGSRCSPVMEGAPAPDGHSANDVHHPHLPIAYSTKVAPFERE